MATKRELIASDKEVEEIRKTLGVDSLAYLSVDALVDCIGIERDQLCLGCLTCEYPTKLPDNIKEYEARRCTC
jgi:amidophosphoribosyltransferase